MSEPVAPGISASDKSRRVPRGVAVALAAITLLAGGSIWYAASRMGGGTSSGEGSIEGILVGCGGPAPGGCVPFDGQVTAQNSNGDSYAASVPDDGRFDLSVPPGRYSLTGSSPHYGNSQYRCLGQGTVTVFTGQTVVLLVDCLMK